MGTFYLLKMIRKVSSAIFFFNLLLRVRKAPAGVFIQYTGPALVFQRRQDTEIDIFFGHVRVYLIETGNEVIEV